MLRKFRLPFSLTAIGLLAYAICGYGASWVLDFSPTLSLNLPPIGALILAILSITSFRIALKLCETEQEGDIISLLMIPPTAILSFIGFDALHDYARWFDPKVTMPEVWLGCLLPFGTLAISAIVNILNMNTAGDKDDHDYTEYGGRTGKRKYLFIIVVVPIVAFWIGLATVLVGYVLLNHQVNWWLAGVAVAAILGVGLIAQKRYLAVAKLQQAQSQLAE